MVLFSFKLPGGYAVNVATAPTVNQILAWNSSTLQWEAESMVTAQMPIGTLDQRYRTNSAATSIELFDELSTLSFIIDGGGSAITTGQKGHLELPFACTITQWTLLADQTGSIVVDIWKNTYANFPPTAPDTITGTDKPTLTNVQKNQSTALTGWTTAIAKGDVLAFNVDSASTVQRVIVSLRARRRD